MTHDASGHQYQYFSSSLPFFRRSDRVPVSEFGDVDFSSGSRQDVRFSIERDAGRFVFSGTAGGGSGAGSFRYSPQEPYRQAMAALGFTGIDADMQFALAVHDVSLHYARELANERLPGLDTAKLISFKFFGGSSQFARQISSMGYERLHINRLIDFRMFNVTPEFITELRRFGYGHVAAEQLITLRVFGVTPELIADIRAREGKTPSIGHLITLRMGDHAQAGAVRSSTDAGTLEAGNTNTNSRNH